MDKYVPHFEKHEVDMSIVHYIDTDRLIHMGISTLGARLRIMESIRKLSAYKELNRTMTIPVSGNDGHTETLLTNMKEMKYLGKSLEKLLGTLPSFITALSKLHDVIGE